MPDIETCKARSTVTIGRFHEADVECGLEVNHEETEHVTAQTVSGRDPKTGKATQVTIIFTWS